jgi:3-oxoadipate enol-lactonase
LIEATQKEGRIVRIEANGIAFNCEIEGPPDAPWLVFSNSLATNLAMWDSQAADLKHSFRPLRYDQRGHGGTDALAGRYSFATLVADALALLDALHIERPDFCGLSMGGATALGLAELHPDRVDRVVVCDSSAMSTPDTAHQWQERIAVAKEGGMEQFVESTLARWFPPETRAANPPHLEKVRQMILTTQINGFIGCAAALADHDYNTAVSTVTRPVLFVAGSKDGATPAAMKDMNARLKGSRYVEIEGAGHISNLDRPAEFTQAVREFLEFSPL